jgi:hypothetical protein
MNHAHCPLRPSDRHVSLDQTEGQCRDKHSCSDEACPWKAIRPPPLQPRAGDDGRRIGQSFAKQTSAVNQF